MNKNNLYDYIIKNKSLPSKVSKEGSSFVVIKLTNALPEGCSEHHISVYDRFIQADVAKQSQYHYTAVLNSGQKIRIYFNVENKIINTQTEEEVDEKLFIALAEQAAKEMVFPIKKELKKRIKADNVAFKKRLAELSRISERFPGSYQEWDNGAGELIDWFVSRKEIHKQDSHIVKQFNFIVGFLNQERVMPEVSGSISPEASIEEVLPSGPISSTEEALPTGVSEVGLFQEKEVQPIVKMKAVLERFYQQESMDLEALRKDYIIISDIESIMGKSECSLVGPGCFSKFYERVGKLAKAHLDIAIMKKEVDKVETFVKEVSLQKIGYMLPEKLSSILFVAPSVENLSLIKVLVEAKIIDLVNYSFTRGEQKYTAMQCAFNSKNKPLMIYLIEQGVSLLSIEMRSGLPFFYVLFSDEGNVCREVLFTEAGSSLMKQKGFLTKLCSILEEKGKADILMEAMRNHLDIEQSGGKIGKIQFLSFMKLWSNSIDIDLSDMQVAKAQRKSFQYLNDAWETLNDHQRHEFLMMMKQGKAKQQEKNQDFLAVLKKRTVVTEEQQKEVATWLTQINESSRFRVLEIEKQVDIGKVVVEMVKSGRTRSGKMQKAEMFNKAIRDIEESYFAAQAEALAEVLQEKQEADEAFSQTLESLDCDLSSSARFLEKAKKKGLFYGIN